MLLKKLPHHRSKYEIDLLVELTQELPFFRQYNKQENGQFIHRECCKHMFAEKLLEGDIVFHVGNCACNLETRLELNFTSSWMDKWKFLSRGGVLMSWSQFEYCIKESPLESWL